MPDSLVDHDDLLLQAILGPGLLRVNVSLHSRTEPGAPTHSR
jgi:hypothetical protein